MASCSPGTSRGGSLHHMDFYGDERARPLAGADEVHKMVIARREVGRQLKKREAAGALANGP